MNPYAPIDLYCERTHPGVWAEPFNAASNLGFLLVAWWLWHRRFSNAAQPEVRALATLIALVGIGSGLFHLFGEVWGNWLDVGFIALFILTYVHRYLRRLAGLPNWQCWLGILAFLAGDRLIMAFGSLGLNGSEGYLSSAGTLVLFAWWARRIAPAAARWLWIAVCVFACSLTLRSLDLALCASWPIGTHFGWHLLNAIVLYCCVRGLAAGCQDTR